MKKKLLILGTGNAQIDLIEYAKSIGLEVYACSYTNTDKGIPLADVFAQINIVDAEKIEGYVKENEIDYIYSVGSDIAVPTFCRVAERLNMFHFVSGKTAERACFDDGIAEELYVWGFAGPSGVQIYSKQIKNSL